MARHAGPGRRGDGLRSVLRRPSGTGQRHMGRPCKCSVITLLYFVPIEVTVDLDLETVVAARQSVRHDVVVARMVDDEHHRRAQEIAESQDWPLTFTETP